MELSRKIRLVILITLLLGTVGCDQATKLVARRHLADRGVIELPAGLGELRLAENPGAFLSLGAGLSESARVWLFTVGTGVGLLGLVAYLLSSARWSVRSFLGAALIVAGGASNLIDRVARDGLVTDFIMLRYGPLRTGVFNLADMLVLFGVGLVFFAQWRTRPTPG